MLGSALASTVSGGRWRHGVEAPRLRLDGPRGALSAGYALAPMLGSALASTVSGGRCITGQHAPALSPRPLPGIASNALTVAAGVPRGMFWSRCCTGRKGLTGSAWLL